MSRTFQVALLTFTVILQCCGAFEAEIERFIHENELKYREDRALVKDPEAFMNVDDIVRYHGYPVEVYNITTVDGYILQIFRIPYGKNGPSSAPRKPVLVQHGLLVSAASWVINTPDKNIAYILADAGYDVWLGNVRGTSYGRRHVLLKPNQKQFWEYSFDEMAKYDVPAMIDHILAKTGYRQLYYIGHSMGTTMMFALLSTQPKYNDIVKTFFALAPVSRLKDVKTPLRLMAPFGSSTRFLLSFVSPGEFLNSSPLTKFFTKTICTSALSLVCDNMLFTLCGFNPAQLNSSRVPVYLHHVPAGTSVQTMVHFSQLLNSGKFQMYDGGRSANLKNYGQATPPEYNLAAVTTQVELFYGDNDYLSPPADVSWLANKLPNLVLKYRVPLKEFTHLDFVWGKDVKVLLYDKLVSEMDRLWKD